LELIVRLKDDFVLTSSLLYNLMVRDLCQSIASGVKIGVKNNDSRGRAVVHASCKRPNCP